MSIPIIPVGAEKSGLLRDLLLEVEVGFVHADA